MKNKLTKIILMAAFVLSTSTTDVSAAQMHKKVLQEKSISVLREAASENDPEAQYVLGIFLLAEGKTKESRKLWEKQQAKALQMHSII